ncbi:hypothetical protein NUW54_g14576 [Trametes sanguinea]|uniref:Uncharacterized protein n=1 Tax=Trametes sanguinea TaxID=158606 RepID=A0ACC1MCR5_9APHY|nr:hypothetical protein NUW54_g14576 [Trametes sanguinea]
MLDANFPQSPPIAHFLSWTNGNGRVNPNLYEEGKVCLSILGTWAGDKSESWSASRSSLLQALVSIQGLVLVKEPWFCEPAYEKLRGTEDGIVNSRLYSEKAYVLSRGPLATPDNTCLNAAEIAAIRAFTDAYYALDQGAREPFIRNTHNHVEGKKAMRNYIAQRWPIWGLNNIVDQLLKDNDVSEQDFALEDLSGVSSGIPFH